MYGEQEWPMSPGKSPGFTSLIFSSWSLYATNLTGRYKEDSVSTGALRGPTLTLPPLPLRQHPPSHSSEASHPPLCAPQPPRHTVPLFPVVTTNSHVTNCCRLDHVQPHSLAALTLFAKAAQPCIHEEQWTELHNVSQGHATESSGDSTTEPEARGDGTET